MRKLERKKSLVKRKSGISKPLVKRSKKRSLYRKARGDLDKKFSRRRK